MKYMDIINSAFWYTFFPEHPCHHPETTCNKGGNCTETPDHPFYHCDCRKGFFGVNCESMWFFHILFYMLTFVSFKDNIFYLYVFNRSIKFFWKAVWLTSFFFCRVDCQANCQQSSYDCFVLSRILSRWLSADFGRTTDFFEWFFGLFSWYCLFLFHIN
jgi:hypothetical protein